MTDTAQALAKLEADERHNTFAEALYWCNQYKLFARSLVADIEERDRRLEVNEGRAIFKNGAVMYSKEQHDCLLYEITAEQDKLRAQLAQAREALAILAGGDATPEKIIAAVRHALAQKGEKT